VDLSTGFTNNKVYKVGQTVVKEGLTVTNERYWYNLYQNKKHIPTIISYGENRIVLEFIERDADINLDDIFKLVEEYSKYSKLNELTFESYVEGIVLHLEKNKHINNGSKLSTLLKSINLEASFAHGDLSIMNILPTKVGLKLIDPLYSDIKFGSYELDFAKLCFSVKYYKNDSASFNYILDRLGISYLNILIAAEAVRVSSYKQEYSFIAENLINEL
jgi:thiamine kinase-like enzyme